VVDPGRKIISTVTAGTAKGRGASGGRQIAGVDVVLDRQWDAGERLGVGVAGFGYFVGDGNERVQVRSRGGPGQQLAGDLRNGRCAPA
jgi:hypothetical protein